MLYIIGVDPLLSSLQQTPRISGVCGFVDDWSMGFHGMLAISSVSNLIHSFEQASGQQINRGKSALILARQLSDDEWASCLAVWNSDIRISSRERVLGVFIGTHESIHDQYYNAVHKFYMALSVFGRVRMSLSLAMRVLVVNISMFSLFLYPNRHFFMPRVLLQEIERKVLRFLILSHGPNWECSRQLAHCMVHNFYDFPMSVVSCPLTKPGLTFAVARSPHWDAGDDDTHFFPILPSVGRLRSIFPAYCRNYTFRNFVGSWSSSSKTTFVFCINGWLVQNSIVGRLTWNIGCKHKDGTVPRCVAHYDTCPGVCLNLTDGFC